VKFIEDAGASADNNKQQEGCLAALLLKKHYLDGRTNEEGLWQIPKD